MTNYCGTEIPDSEYVNKIANENDGALTISMSGEIATITAKIVDVDADQKVNITSYQDRREENNATIQIGEDSTALITAKILPNTVTFDPNSIFVTTEIAPASSDPCDIYHCFLKIIIDDKYVLWSFYYKSFFTPGIGFHQTLTPNSVITESEWAEWENNNIHYCQVEVGYGDYSGDGLELGKNFPKPDFSPWEGPIENWTCINNSSPPGFTGSCWEYYESNIYGDMKAYYLDEGEFCVPIPGGTDCTHYYAGVVEHNLYSMQKNTGIKMGISMEGIRENKLYRQEINSHHPDHAGTIINYCEAFERNKQESVRMTIICLAPDNPDIITHPYYPETNPTIGLFLSDEARYSQYFTCNTIPDGGHSKIKYESTLTPSFTTPMYEENIYGGFSNFTNLKAEGSLGIAFVLESYGIANSKTKTYLSGGITLLAFTDGIILPGQEGELLYNHSISDAISINITGQGGILEAFGYTTIENLIYNAANGSVSDKINVQLIGPQGCYRKCA